MEQTHDLATAARELVSRALVPYGERPSAAEVARLLDELTRHGWALHGAVLAVPEPQRSLRAAGGLADWSHLVADPPRGITDSTRWSYCRAVARALRTLLRALEEREHSHAHAHRPAGAQ
ncbi:hypothetical protein ABT084_34015 [Streptomyces sp. NPDC002138]|uniref:hypothetical protein n=1 Tax=Streptomyces sp. NPDC002138 TaxID=3154410 RepID=UPI0033328170